MAKQSAAAPRTATGSVTLPVATTAATSDPWKTTSSNPWKAIGDNPIANLARSAGKAMFEGFDKTTEKLVNKAGTDESFRKTLQNQLEIQQILKSRGSPTDQIDKQVDATMKAVADNKWTKQDSLRALEAIVEVGTIGVTMGGTAIPGVIGKAAASPLGRIATDAVLGAADVGLNVGAEGGTAKEMAKAAVAGGVAGAALSGIGEGIGALMKNFSGKMKGIKPSGNAFSDLDTIKIESEKAAAELAGQVLPTTKIDSIKKKMTKEQMNSVMEVLGVKGTTYPKKLENLKDIATNNYKAYEAALEAIDPKLVDYSANSFKEIKNLPDGIADPLRDSLKLIEDSKSYPELNRLLKAIQEPGVTATDLKETVVQINALYPKKNVPAADVAALHEIKDYVNQLIDTLLPSGVSVNSELLALNKKIAPLLGDTIEKTGMTPSQVNDLYHYFKEADGAINEGNVFSKLLYGPLLARVGSKLGGPTGWIIGDLAGSVPAVRNILRGVFEGGAGVAKGIGTGGAVLGGYLSRFGIDQLGVQKIMEILNQPEKQENELIRIPAGTWQSKQ